jgi:hypothetical protein
MNPHPPTPSGQVMRIAQCSIIDRCGATSLWRFAAGEYWHGERTDNCRTPAFSECRSACSRKPVKKKILPDVLEKKDLRALIYYASYFLITYAGVKQITAEECLWKPVVICPLLKCVKSKN